MLFLLAAVFLLDGEVLRSFFVDLLPSASPGLRGAAWLVTPLRRSRVAADPVQEPSMDADARRRDDDGDLWCRSSGIGDRRLPAGLGGLRIQGIKRSSGSGAPPTALVVSAVVNLQKDRAVIFVLMRAFL